MKLRQALTQTCPAYLVCLVVGGGVGRSRLSHAHSRVIGHFRLYAVNGRLHLLHLRPDRRQGTLLRSFFLLANCEHSRKGKERGHSLGGKRCKQSFGVGEGAQVTGVLTQKGLHRGQHLQRAIQLRVGAPLVSPDTNQIL